MNLTPKQEKFAQCVADGMTQADAYRVAYVDGVRCRVVAVVDDALVVVGLMGANV